MTRQRVIDVKKQKKLPLAKCLRLVLSGITHRLLRSGLTTSVVLLAVAFFMAMLTEGVFVRSIGIGVRAEIDHEREASRFLAFISSKPSTLEISAALARICTDEAALEEYAAVAGTGLRKIKALARQCRQEQIYLAWFENMGVGKKLILVGKAEGRSIFAALKPREKWLGFLAHLEPLRSLKLPDGEQRFHAFVLAYPEFIADLSEFSRVWSGRINALQAELRKITGDQPTGAWLSAALPDRLTQWRNAVNSAGFNLSQAKLERVRQAMRRLVLRNQVAAALTEAEVKKRWKREFKKRMTLDQKLALAGSERVRAILNRQFSLDALRQVAGMVKCEQNLLKLEKALAGRTQEESGSILSGRQIFLLVISFVVCMVGIANAMLMAITERFREIATMKCLGATDGYILVQFMLEAGLQGIAGGTCGMLVGLILALAKNGVIFGVYLFRYFPLGDVLVCGLVSVLIGTILSALASLYPSWAASRMAPMEAMRVE